MLTLFRFLLVSFLCGKIDGFISSDKRVHQKPKIPVASMSSKEYAPTKSKKRKRSLSKIDDCSIPNASLKNVKEEDMMITDEECFEPLQIPCEINGHVIPAIIDTGAQVTVMSLACARRCGISNLVDARYSGQAVGMGSSDILGRINGLSMRVGPISYQNQVCILRESRVDLILGLDFLKRFKCEINLEKNLLKLNVRGRTIRLSFISNHSGSLQNLGFVSRNELDTNDEDILLHDEENSSEDDVIDYDSNSQDTDDVMQYKNQKQTLQGYSDVRNKIKSNYQEIDNYKTDVHNVIEEKNKNQSLQDYYEMKNYIKKKQEKEKLIIPTSTINDYDDCNSDDENYGDDLKGFVHVSMEGV